MAIRSTLGDNTEPGSFGMPPQLEEATAQSSHFGAVQRQESATAEHAPSASGSHYAAHHDPTAVMSSAQIGGGNWGGGGGSLAATGGRLKGYEANAAAGRASSGYGGGGGGGGGKDKGKDKSIKEKVTDKVVKEGAQKGLTEAAKKAAPYALPAAAAAAETGAIALGVPAFGAYAGSEQSSSAKAGKKLREGNFDIKEDFLDKSTRYLNPLTGPANIMSAAASAVTGKEVSAASIPKAMIGKAWEMTPWG
jgi:hypothetical protein